MAVYRPLLPWVHTKQQLHSLLPEKAMKVSSVKETEICPLL